MKKLNLLSCTAIGAIAAIGMSSPAFAQLDDEVIVTATKKSQSMQDIAIAVQAFNAEQLEEQNIDSFEDYVKYLPSVNAGGRGPGQNELYIRGAAIDAINTRRATLGAAISRLEHTVDNLENNAVNHAASRSRILDADYAAETTELARTQIIQQAGTAMLSQANQKAQAVLKLLQN